MADEIVPDRKPWQSKTVWASFAVAFMAFFPAFQAWVSAHPEMSSLLVAGLMAGLRKISNGKIVLS